MDYVSRLDRFKELFPKEPKFRIKQIEKNLFNWAVKDWKDMSDLPEKIREGLENEKVAFLSVEKDLVLISKKKDTYKARLKLQDGSLIESILMQNKRGQWTICVSSQIGCAMGCHFCATGKMGLTRSLDAEEIIDQYRMWKYFLAENPKMSQRISNIVFMGMGEPLANYNNVKLAINTLLKYTDLGETKITVSTVGVIPALEKILKDEEWPRVRIAISLHSADSEARKKIVPTSFDGFLDKLADWARRYLKQFGNSNHHLTFEYVLLNGATDTLSQAEQLADYVRSIGNVKVNLIPYNFVGADFECSEDSQIKKFMQILQDKGVNVVRRRNMGEDIDAACGQLASRPKDSLNKATD